MCVCVCVCVFWASYVSRICCIFFLLIGRDCVVLVYAATPIFGYSCFSVFF